MKIFSQNNYFQRKHVRNILRKSLYNEYKSRQKKTPGIVYFYSLSPFAHRPEDFYRALSNVAIELHDDSVNAAEIELKTIPTI